ncbi:MAG: hypothetical protein RBT71_07250 [Flavobacteriales bacterium]|nr:hypothetical protein [Flavobacteriales bacterium]
MDQRKIIGLLALCTLVLLLATPLRIGGGERAPRPTTQAGCA